MSKRGETWLDEELALISIWSQEILAMLGDSHKKADVYGVSMKLTEQGFHRNYNQCPTKVKHHFTQFMQHPSILSSLFAQIIY